jgi:hypothetical protein
LAGKNGAKGKKKPKRKAGLEEIFCVDFVEASRRRPLRGRAR